MKIMNSQPWNKRLHNWFKNDFKYIDYTKIALPVIVASILYAFNNFVDNFMVTTVNGGVAALSIANTWTGILNAVFFGLSYISIPAFAQYFGRGDYKHTRDVLKFRVLSTFIFAVILTIVALAIPEQMITVFSPNESEEVVRQGATYIRIITITWVLLSLSFTYGSALREIGLGKLQMYNSIAILATNVTFNSIFIYGLQWGVEGAAVASVIARLVAVTSNYVVMYIKRRELIFRWWRLVFIDITILKMMRARIPGATLAASSQILIFLRNTLWNYGYPAGTVGDEQFMLSAASIIGITGSVTGIFLSALNSISATTSVFVTQALGRNEIEIARKHSDHLKIYNMGLGFVFAFGLIIVIMIFPYLTFFTRGQYDNQLALANVENATVTQTQALANAELIQTQMLREMQLTLVPVCFLMPSWFWFITSRNSVQTGKLNNALALLDFLANVAQFIWLIVVCIGFALNIPFFQGKLWFAVLVFYLSDIPKIIPYEWAYYKWNWATNITSEDLNPKGKFKLFKPRA